VGDGLAADADREAEIGEVGLKAPMMTRRAMKSPAPTVPTP
jgi:hypothetical protein